MRGFSGRNVFMTVIVAAVVAIFVGGGVAGAQAQQQADRFQVTGVSVSAGVTTVAHTNGYRIRNNSGEPLVFDSVSQKSPHDPANKCIPQFHAAPFCVAHGFGFEQGKKPPAVILPGDTAVIEIPAYLYRGFTYDDTVIAYRLGGDAGEKVTFAANVWYEWAVGSRYFRADFSSCAPSTLCRILDSEHTTGKGTQTTFTVAPL